MFCCPLAEELCIYHKKKRKIKNVDMDFFCENKSIGEDLFLDKK